MQTHKAPQSRVRQTVNDLVLAEMFLVQATVESAAVIGDGLGELGRQLNDEEQGRDSWETISTSLQRIADNALEPYATRYKYFRTLLKDNS